MTSFSRSLVGHMLVRVLVLNFKKVYSGLKVTYGCVTAVVDLLRAGTSTVPSTLNSGVGIWYALKNIKKK